MLRFDVFDVEGSFTTSDASRLDVSQQVGWRSWAWDTIRSEEKLKFEVFFAANRQRLGDRLLT